MSRRKKRILTTPQSLTQAQNSRLLKSFHWFGGTGILVVLLTGIYQHFFGGIALEYVQSLNQGYEFQIKNDTPSDRIVSRFRVAPPLTQNVIYKSTEDVYAERNDKGEITLPGGNVSYVPAAEFKELDGQQIAANSSIKFRVPPLSSRSWMVPEAVIVDIKYEIEPANIVLKAIESIINITGIQAKEKLIRYLVVGNYWAVSHSKALDEALRVACRDDDSLAKIEICNLNRKFGVEK